MPTLVVSDGMVYCFGGRSGTSALASELEGSGDVTESHRKWTSVKGTNACSPLIVGGRLYWTSDQQGIAFCADAESGDLIYEERLPRCDQVYASAPVNDSWRVITSANFFKFKLGKMRWVKLQRLTGDRVKNSPLPAAE